MTFEAGLAVIMGSGGLLVTLMLAAVVAKVRERAEGARHV